MPSTTKRVKIVLDHSTEYQLRKYCDKYHRGLTDSARYLVEQRLAREIKYRKSMLDELL